MTTTTPPRPATAPRLWAAAAVASAAGVVAALTLAPRSIVGPLRSLFTRMADAAAAPLVEWMSYGDQERLFNALLFVPLGATLALLLGRRLWPVAIIAGFALSAAVEHAQGTIPGRVPDPQDIVWNTLGAAAGALAVALCLGAAALVPAVRRSSA